MRTVFSHATPPGGLRCRDESRVWHPPLRQRARAARPVPGGPVSRQRKIGLCADSNAQLPKRLIERFDVEVVPLTVSVDGHEYLEGVDLDADQFYEMFTDDHRPVVSTSQPSAGQFALAYEELAARGCTEILSVHVSAAISSTLNAARLGARGFDIPVRLVDSGSSSFGVGCCVWAAGDAIAR